MAMPLVVLRTSVVALTLLQALALAFRTTYAGPSSEWGTDADIVVITSDDLGATWSAAVPLYSASARGCGQPALSVGNKTYAVFASSDPVQNSGNDFDIVFVESTDKGATWSSPVTVNSDAAADGTFTNVEPSMGVLGERVVVVWASQSFSNYPLHMRVRQADGSWGTQTTLSSALNVKLPVVTVADSNKALVCPRH